MLLSTTAWVSVLSLGDSMHEVRRQRVHGHQFAARFFVGRGRRRQILCVLRHQWHRKSVRCDIFCSRKTMLSRRPSQQHQWVTHRHLRNRRQIQRLNSHCFNHRTRLPLAIWLYLAFITLVENIVKHDSWPIQPDILNPTLLRLTSRKPLWLDLQPVDIKSRWKHNWKSAQVVNSHL